MMAHKPIITRTRAKWASLAALVVLVSAALASMRFVVLYQSTGISSGRETIFAIRDGTINFTQFTPQRLAGPAIARPLSARSARQSANDALRGWSFLDLRDYAVADRTNSFASWPRYSSKGTPPTLEIHIPFWLPTFLLVVITALFFYRDRKPKPGQCINCRYNLAGLESNRCPECGTEIPQAI